LREVETGVGAAPIEEIAPRLAHAAAAEAS
jgi:hypothetical protein